jgi:hypothetical protein
VLYVLHPNPQTGVRIARLRLMEAAGEVGNAALSELASWPASGEGRQVKALSESIIRRLDAVTATSNLANSMSAIENSAFDIQQILNNSFFIERIGQKISKYGGKNSTLRDFLIRNIELYSNIRAAYGFHNDESDVSLATDFINDRPHDTKPRKPKTVAKPNVSQKVGPFQYDYHSGVLKVSEKKSSILSQDRNSAEAAKDEILRISESLQNEISSSNIDPRLFNQIELITKQIKESSSVIVVGLSNITLSSLVTSLYDEIPDHLSSRIDAFRIATGMYVGQSQDWHRFCDNAAQSEISQNDITAAIEAARRSLPRLIKYRKLIDPEVPKSLELMLELVNDPAKSGTRSIFGLIRTIENLTAALWGAIYRLYQAGLLGVEKGVTNGLSAAVTIGVIATTLQLSSGISPSAARALRADWIEPMRRSLQRILDEGNTDAAGGKAAESATPPSGTRPE